MENEENELFYAIENKYLRKVKFILENSNKIKKILKLNEKNKYGEYPLLLAIIENDIEIVQLLIEYANKNNIILELNEKTINESYPLLWAIENNNIEMVKILIEYSNQHNIILKLNDNKNEYGWYPLLKAIDKNNIEIVKSILTYANNNNIILELNEKNEDKYYPLFYAIKNNNVKIVKLLIEYANTHNIIMEYEKDDIGQNSEIIELLQIYEKEKKNNNYLINSQEKIKYDQYFNSIDLNRNQYVTGEQCKVFFSKSGLSTQDLAQIWELSDISKTGYLSREEFYIAMHLIRLRKNGMDLPSKIPECLIQSSKQKNNVNKININTNNMNNDNDEYIITPKEKSKYDQFFDEININNNQYVTGEECMNFFSKSGLSTQDLAQIWELSDISKVGYLSRDEFYIAMHLIRLKKNGMDLPPTTPECLIPPSKKRNNINK
eukprot:jgi/Orpsp1_1/1176060/evm.model.c7180000056261.1